MSCDVINVFPTEEGLNFNFFHFKDKIKEIKFFELRRKICIKLG